TLTRSSVSPLARVFLRHSQLIEMEGVVITFREPEDDLVTPREAVQRIVAEFKVPNNPVAQVYLVCLLVRSEARIKEHVKRYDLGVPVRVMANLPTDAAARASDTHCFIDHFLL